jgi:hypothetical protein
MFLAPLIGKGNLAVTFLQAGGPVFVEVVDAVRTGDAFAVIR